MNKTAGFLFDPQTIADKFKAIPDEELAPILQVAREQCGCEDRWDADAEIQVRKMVADKFGVDFLGLDPSLVTGRFITVRLNKKAAKTYDESHFVDRLGRLLRDYQRNIDRTGGARHSQEYIEYVINQSPEWVEKARQHKQRCNYRCQLCDRETNLDVHHTAEGYRYLRNEQPWHLLAVCRNPCHEIADMLRAGKF